ncbi:hypothetical protein KIN20_006436 [Parelaphostrongylus tenuis]|uniref:Uncharacterized protein n=1 Tax=Parelaphostrongylus tenuis TaxID=148309 RepID=A0AAD5QFZ0_PARTN|nr:hypothetical protein KIN20_006436 [Parelaphostrongylus tenuis]
MRVLKVIHRRMVLRESSSNFKDKDSEVQDISEGSSQTDEKSITEKMDVDKVSGQDDTEAKAEMPERKEDVDEAKDQSATEAKAEVPKRRSSTRHAATPQAENKTPTRVATSGRKVKAVSTIKKKNEENESAPESVGDGDNSSIVEEKDSSNRKSMRPRSRRSNVKDSVKTELSTPSSQKKGRRSAKLDVGIPNENNDDRQEASDDAKKKVDTSDKDSSRRSFRRRSAKQLVKIEDTPKSDARSGSSSKKQNKISVEKESAESQEGDTPRRRKKGGDPEVMKKSDRSSKTIFKKEKESKQRSHDPYDIETEMEKHPEPLKNIQMEVQSFGEVKYAKVGSGKYERTEKTAELRVGNLADMTPRTKQRKSLADLTPGRKRPALLWLEAIQHLNLDEAGSQSKMLRTPWKWKKMRFKIALQKRRQIQLLQNPGLDLLESAEHRPRHQCLHLNVHILRYLS